MPEPQRSRTFARAERKFDLMGELGCDLLMICSNVAPDSLGGIDRAAADFHELGERAQKRGIRVGFEALAWGKHISDYRDSWEVVRRADHPAIGLTLDSFHIFSRKTDLKAIRSIPARQDRAGPARRRAVARHGRDQLEPALPLLPRPGRFPADRLHGCGVRHRLQRHPVAGNLQRPVPRRLAARRRRRWPALAGLSDGPDARPARRARQGRAANPAARQMPRHRVPRIRRRRSHRGRTREAVCRAGLPQGRRAQVEGGRRTGRKARSISCSTATRTASRIRTSFRTGRRSARSA